MHPHTMSPICIIPIFYLDDEEKANGTVKTQVIGSFYLRVGAIAFGIGSMVYSGLEFGQYFELKGEKNCRNFLIALTPASRMLLSLVQMQFIFINTKEFQMERHKVISRFGLMHMIATNLCEWLYVLVEETKHEIVHFSHKHFDNYEREYSDIPSPHVFVNFLSFPRSDAGWSE